MNEKLKELIAKYQRGEQLTQDELDFISAQDATVTAGFGFANKDLGTAAPLDLAYQRIKSGEATAEDYSIFKAENETLKSKTGTYKYDPSLYNGRPVEGSTDTSSLWAQPNFANIISSGSPFELPKNGVAPRAEFTQPMTTQTPGVASEVKNYVPDWVTNPLQLGKQNQTQPQNNIGEVDVNNNKIPDYLERDEVAPANDVFKTQPFLPYLYPGGSDLSTELYSLGRAIGAPKGAPGRTATGIGAAGAALLDMTRNVASGIGYEKANSFSEDWYRKKLQEEQYKSQPQTRDTNNVGGGQGRDGGLFEGHFFALGGEQELGNGEHNQMEEGQENAQQQSQEQPQADPLQQVIQLVTQLLQQGAPQQEVIKALVEQGIPQEQAVQIVQQVMQQQQQQEPTTKDGKTVNAQPGQEISFKHGGKKVSGVVKEIRDGKIILE